MRSLRSLAIAADVTAVSDWVTGVGIVPELHASGAAALPHVFSTASVEMRRDSKYMHDCLASALLSPKSISAVAFAVVSPSGTRPASSTSIQRLVANVVAAELVLITRL